MIGVFRIIKRFIQKKINVRLLNKYPVRLISAGKDYGHKVTYNEKTRNTATTAKNITAAKFLLDIRPPPLFLLP